MYFPGHLASSKSFHEEEKPDGFEACERAASGLRMQEAHHFDGGALRSKAETSDVFQYATILCRKIHRDGGETLRNLHQHQTKHLSLTLLKSGHGFGSFQKGAAKAPLFRPSPRVHYTGRENPRVRSYIRSKKVELLSGRSGRGD